MDDYVFDENQEKEMMTRACADIERADILIAALTEKAIGVGLQVGYAAALKKPIVYLKDKTGEYSKTVGGLSTKYIEYSSLDDLKQKISHALQEITT